ncbi:SUKH-4 family immunity protein [Streptomyces cyslabdanicus]|uniref:SUKH-4 family immunity protein n=1 Tax=Streptomyces cyslabdanicus TaxID=1470456 RepID=UPI00404449F8
MSTTDTIVRVITLPEAGCDPRRAYAEFAFHPAVAPTRPAARVRPAVPAVRPGTASGLTLDLRARLLHRDFGHGRVARYEEVDFPAALTHEPTRRFLRDTGLPEDGVLLQSDTDVPLPTLAEFCADECPDDFWPDELPARAAHLIRLGRFAGGSSLLVDGITGEVLTWSGPAAEPAPLTKDVSTLAFTLWLLRRGRDGTATRRS